jgi:hypothetical protein
MSGLLQRLRCSWFGHQLEHWRNIYGDEINHMGGKRSIWTCTKCGVYKLRPELYEVDSSEGGRQ